jgi:hypothetical protein
MVSFGRRHRDQGRRTGPDADEDPVVRQYRFLLRVAPPDAVEVAHAEALPRLSPDQRQAVLAAVQGGLVAGQRLTPDDTAQLAHLIVLGERRSPTAFLATCEPSTLLALSQGVIHSEACFGLFGQYAGWDGADPEPEDSSAWADAGFNPDSGRWNPARKSWQDASGIVSGAGGGGGDGGGGGGGG